MGDATLYHRALALEHEGRFAEAFRLFEQCAEDATFDEGDLAFHCGWCLENAGETARALEFYERAASLARVPACKLNSYFRAGWLLMHAKETIAAADFFRYVVDYGDLVDLRNDAYQHGMYWYAHCLEVSGRYLDALTWYRRVQELAPQLDPESRLRQIFCLVHTGQFNEALNVCRTFDAPVPEGFDPQRYTALRDVVGTEHRMLERALEPVHEENLAYRYAIG